MVVRKTPRREGNLRGGGGGGEEEEGPNGQTWGSARLRRVRASVRVKRGVVVKSEVGRWSGEWRKKAKIWSEKLECTLSSSATAPKLTPLAA